MRPRSPLFAYLLLLLLPILAAPGNAEAQTTGGRRMLKGTITMSGEAPQAYIIYFSASGTKLTGKSVTAQHSGTPLTAAIIGQFNAAGTEMYLKETHSLDARGLNGFTYYCFFTARLKLTQQGRRRIWSGRFISTAEDGGPCGEGTMRFEDVPAPPEPPSPRPQPPQTEQRTTPPPVAARPTSRPIQPRPRPRADTPQRRPARPTPPPVVVRDTPEPVPIVVQPAPVIPPPDTTGLRPLYTWASDTLSVEIWDGYEEDGDVVSVLFNDRIILPQQTLSRHTKPRFSLPLRSNAIDTLKIILHAEGREPPCTPRLVLYDGQAHRDVDVSGVAGETALLYFKRWR